MGNKQIPNTNRHWVVYKNKKFPKTFCYLFWILSLQKIFGYWVFGLSPSAQLLVGGGELGSYTRTSFVMLNYYPTLLKHFLGRLECIC